MNKKQRLHILKQAQTATTTTTNPAAPATVPAVPPATIDIRTIPNFNVNLFNARPEIINDINEIVNIINKYLSMLSTPQGSITFNMVWSNPSISGSQSSNSVKNLLNLAKWIYNVVRARVQAYSLDGLRAIGNGLITTVKSYSFPESNASTVQNDLINAGQKMLAKLGPANH